MEELYDMYGIGSEIKKNKKTFRDFFACGFGCNFVFYPLHHKNRFLWNGILSDHYTLKNSTESMGSVYF